MLKSIKNINMEISKKSQNLNGRDNIVSNQATDNNAPVIQNSSMTTNIFGIDTKTLQLMFGMSEDKIKAEFDLKLENRIRKLETEINKKLSDNNISPQNTVDPNLIAFYKRLHFLAACSSSDLDINMLSELLIKRLEKRDNRENILAIEKAAEMVNYVKEEDLVALCVYFYITYMKVESKTVNDGLEEFITMIKKLKGDSTLPSDGKWIENFGIINSVRIIDNATGDFTTYSYCIARPFGDFDRKDVNPKFITDHFSDNSLFNEIKALLERMEKQLLIITPVGLTLINVFFRIRIPDFEEMQISY